MGVDPHLQPSRTPLGYLSFHMWDSIKSHISDGWTVFKVLIMKRVQLNIIVPPVHNAYQEIISTFLSISVMEFTVFILNTRLQQPNKAVIISLV